ncbi:MAG: aspartate aminotransferase family protein, partial [Polyangiaceae bacterium]
LMDNVAPLGPVYQAGTLSGNPVAVSAGLATLDLLDLALYERLEDLGARLARGLEAAITERGAEACVQRVGSMITLFFTKGPVRSWADAKRCDVGAFGRWHGALLERGVYWPPAQFEAAFISGAHTEQDIDATVDAGAEALVRALPPP